MDKILFQNKQYDVRQITLPNVGNVNISTTVLNKLLLNNDGSYVSEEAVAVDESIYYFVDVGEIYYSEEELLKLLKIEILC
ncbi:hypothetical protein SAMN05421847_1842 [Halpernia humi]|uniref:Uncharacterized protein n=1 Tax=Halpernia humi TaxID=493375 RepID=A0A1H5YS46_9FLAO|nr:hypothetical protein [Halpernia humi]SEG26981.1 hypothetical protein SAMN05421847_1842 [Halpernia humi]